jgi:hypothetical protein
MRSPRVPCKHHSFLSACRPFLITEFAHVAGVKFMNSRDALDGLLVKETVECGKCLLCSSHSLLGDPLDLTVTSHGESVPQTPRR